MTFGVVNQGSSTDLVQIDSNDVPFVTPVLTGEQFVAWPHLTANGGLASIDPQGNVFTWTYTGGFTYTRSALAHAAGPADALTTFWPGPASVAGSPESLAILYHANGQAFVQIVGTDGSVGTPIAVPGSVGVSIVAGDFNGDGIEDLAVLTNTAVDFLINDGKGVFTQNCIPVSGEFSIPQPNYGKTSLVAVSVLGTPGQQPRLGHLPAQPPRPHRGLYHHLHRFGCWRARRAPGRSLGVDSAPVSPNLGLIVAPLTTPSREPGTLGLFWGFSSDPFIGAYGITVSATIDNSYTLPASWTQSGGPLGRLDFGLDTAGTGTARASPASFTATPTTTACTTPASPGLGGIPVQVITPTTSFSWRAFTGDADSGLSTSNDYTLAVNFNDNPVTINGVNFADGMSPSGPATPLRPLIPVPLPLHRYPPIPISIPTSRA